MVTDSTVKGRLILVEDDAAFRGILTVLFESVGWEVMPAGDGRVALALAEGAEPDVIVTDLMMPRMSGIQLASELESSAAMPDIPCVAITSDTSGLRQAALRSGLFFDVLSKPLAPGDLLDTVRRASQANGEA